MISLGIQSSGIVVQSDLWGVASDLKIDLCKIKASLQIRKNTVFSGGFDESVC